MNWKMLGGMVVLGIVGTGLAAPAQAHLFETNQAIRALLHITPDDDPVIGHPAQLLFEFRDREKKFKFADCDCRIRITQGERELVSESLAATSTASPTFGQFSFAFPLRGIYEVDVVGAPRDPNGFQAFKLAYTVRVTRESANSFRLPRHFLHVVAVGAFAGIVLSLFIYNYFKRP